MSESADRVPTLRYDSDCPFCAASARLIEARAPGRVVLVAAPGIDAAELSDGGQVRRGGAAVTGALALRPGWRWLRLLDAPGARTLRDVAYALVARSRWWLSRRAR